MRKNDPCSTVDVYNHPDFSNTTYYVAPSGTVVFAVDSIYWTAALDSYRLFPDQSCPDRSLVVPGVQQLRSNMMHALLTYQLKP